MRMRRNRVFIRRCRDWRRGQKKLSQICPKRRKAGQAACFNLLILLMARDGVEPPTHGFSVRRLAPVVSRKWLAFFAFPFIINPADQRKTDQAGVQRERKKGNSGPTSLAAAPAPHRARRRSTGRFPELSADTSGRSRTSCNLSRS